MGNITMYRLGSIFVQVALQKEQNILLKSHLLNKEYLQTQTLSTSGVYCWSEVSKKENMFYNIEVMALNIVAAAS